MIKNLKVKILKKSKDAPYPEHIIVERPETHELAHLYFNEGTLSKLTHIKRDSQIKMAWNEREKKYEALLPSYVVFQECLIILKITGILGKLKKKNILMPMDLKLKDQKQKYL